MDDTLDEDEKFRKGLPNVVTDSLNQKVKFMTFMTFSAFTSFLLTQDQQIRIKTKPLVQKMDDMNEANQLRLTTKHQQLAEMENHQICEKSLEFIENFGFVLGVNTRFDWKPGARFVHSLFQMFMILSQLTYTQYLHVKTHNYYRLLETLAIYGITISVNENLN